MRSLAFRQRSAGLNKLWLITPTPKKKLKNDTRRDFLCARAQLSFASLRSCFASLRTCFASLCGNLQRFRARPELICRAPACLGIRFELSLSGLNFWGLAQGLTKPGVRKKNQVSEKKTKGQKKKRLRNYKSLDKTTSQGYERANQGYG